MRWCRIIKACDEPEVKVFDFRDISAERRAPGVADAGDCGAMGNGSEGASPAAGQDPSASHQAGQAEHPAQQLYREAYEEGFSKGREDGLAQGRQSMLEARRHLEHLLEQMAQLPSRVVHDYREWLVSTSLKVARHVVQKEIEQHPELLVKAIEALLEEAEEQNSLTLHLHPDDIELLEEHAGLEALRQSARSFVIRPDAGLARGGCRLENDIQLLDASLDTRFALIEEALKSDGSVSQEDISES